MTQPAEKPLKGIRVLDLTNVLSGPYCTYQLALLGAEVIKIERPHTGDLARNLGADPKRNNDKMGISFLAQNADKASVTLDLKNAKAASIFRKLVKTAHVIVENFRPGVMQRLGLSYEELRKENPELIFCAISGFGQTGLRSADPAYDQIIQGFSGVMSITGDSETAPLRVGYPLADTLGGLTAAFSITAALNARPRGAFLDISMTDAVLSGMGWVVSNYLIGGVLPQAHGNENTTSAPSGTFQTMDQPINIAANTDQQWMALTEALECSELLSDPQYLTREDRKENRLALKQDLEAILNKRSSQEWLESLTARGVPAGPVLGVAEALEDPQIKARHLTQSLAFEEEVISLLSSPMMINDRRPNPEKPPPVLGQNTIRILTELGYETSEIDAMREQGII